MHIHLHVGVSVVYPPPPASFERHTFDTLHVPTDLGVNTYAVHVPLYMYPPPLILCILIMTSFWERSPIHQ